MPRERERGRERRQEGSRRDCVGCRVSPGDGGSGAEGDHALAELLPGGGLGLGRDRRGLSRTGARNREPTRLLSPRAPGPTEVRTCLRSESR